ncbi:MAG: SRPBCC family protein [Bacteroidota bacterium]
MIRILIMTLMITGMSMSVDAQSMSKKYKTVIAEQLINAPAELVWEAMVLDYGEISNFSPYIYASSYESGSLKGELNAERKCDFNAKGTRWTHEKIVEIDQDNMIMKNVVVDAQKFPLNTDNSFAYYRVKDNGDGTSTASYEFRYRTKPGIMTGLVKGKFQKTLDDTLVGLKHYVETGEVVNAASGNWKEVKAEYAN